LGVKAELLVDAKNTLGECALWCERSQSVLWTDIQRATLSRFTPASGALRHWSMPERVGSFVLCADSPDRLLLGLATRVAFFDLRTEALTPVGPVETDEPRTRINDGRCDPQGRFVFGMYNEKGSEPIGHFYRVNADLGIERLPLPRVAVANSLAFSPDGSRLYFCDSESREIQCCDYRADGSLGTARVFVRLPEGTGYPDGSTVDAEGGLWNAQWAGGSVVRYDREGHETTRIAVAATQPSCVCFGGAALDTLYITTARKELSEEALAAQPLAGGLFTAPAGFRGLPERRFGAP
jgi:L-arabinonolactonase